MLHIRNLSASYGHIEALRDVSIDIGKGQIVSIIGSNGAGKTTLLRCISGLIKPTSGSIEFMGKPISQKPHLNVAAGIVHVPEGRKCFSGLTIQDNLLVGGYLIRGKKLLQNLRRAYDLFPILEQRRNQYAGTLSGGEQQMLAICRGLMSDPKLMLLDEPSLGLAPLVMRQVFDLVEQIRNSGITILLVEQNAQKALCVCDKAHVLENGRIAICGSGAELLASPAVKKAYLGE
ncbi:MAG TPA: ABC transporter ATP-binding protein [Rectinema sp.]|mgnify:FL=1|nr:ABC transporter ATP-binding protein [Rectinema sp.]HPW46561.1 ABC transporter ATP-binding protein [Rectinema sp.]